MTREEAVNWLINIMADIGYEQELSEIRELLEAQPEVIACGSGELIVDATGDLVSRAAAIDAIDKALSRTFIEPCGEMILKDLPSAQPDSCEGCKHLGQWENEVEYGYPSPCTCCRRRTVDHYER